MKPDLRCSRFYAILDTAYVTPAHWEARCRSLLEGGADIVQVRAKRESTAERIRLVEAVLPLCSDASVPLIVNDDMDAVLAFPKGQVGIHLGQEDTPVEAARTRLGPETVMGVSTHSLPQARAAIQLARLGLIDYFAVGPLFPTPTKPDYAAVGLELPMQVEQENPPVPYFCIGGITRATIDQVVRAGIRRIVVVSDVLRAAEPAAVVRSLKSRLPCGNPE